MESIASFVATAASAEELEDLEAFVVVLAEKPDGDGARLEIQRAMAFSQEDEELGMDTYCLCTQMGATHYGGVLSWTFAEPWLRILLDAAAAAELGLDPQVRIRLQLPPIATATTETAEVVVAGIRRVLDLAPA